MSQSLRIASVNNLLFNKQITYAESLKRIGIIRLEYEKIITK